MKHKIFKIVSLGVKYLLILLMCFIIIMPISIFILASMKTNMEFAKTTLFQFPEAFNIENYKQVFVKGHLLTAYKNTVILLLGGVTLNIIFGTMLAYALGRLGFLAGILSLQWLWGQELFPLLQHRLQPSQL